MSSKSKPRARRGAATVTEWSRVEALEGRTLFAMMPVPMVMPFTGFDYGGGGSGSGGSGSSAQGKKLATFARQDLVSDVPGAAANTDANLKNGWGLAVNPVGFWWVASNGTGLSTQYDAGGAPAPAGLGTPPDVTVPGPNGQANGGAVTGVVFSGGSDFVVSEGGRSGASRFVFSTEEGVIAGWSPDVDETAAVTAIDRSAQGAVYKGLATTATAGGQDRLYAADFHNNRIDVFDGNFQPAQAAGAFADPKLPKGYAPFNVQNLGGNLYVAYAQQDAEGKDEVAGKGKGYVDVFDADGTLVRRFARKGKLNAPWGMALAPADFGKFAGDVLVGNFGDGRIQAFDTKGHSKGFLRGTDNKPLAIAGLWGLGFGNGGAAGPTNTLFFAAGPNGEANGLFGSLALAAPTKK